ncbi:MAG: D-arabinono-1,4-lactone oxidase [Phylliscum demangeonii]|nr:MAG: D-arabinono-1,4-lactone oxidase [Phylliscum demangeonii]
MDPLLQHEIDSFQPEVAFRACCTHHHHTWAKTFHSRPELYLRPRSTAEIQKIVSLARRCRRRITLVGSGHSPSDLTCTSSWLVNLDDYSAILSVDRARGLVVMQGGIRLRALRQQLAAHGLALPNLGSIDSQAMAGALATATHGSSLQHGLLSGSVRALRLVLANGRAIECSAAQNADLFRAALVSLGALGVVVEVVFQAVPAYDVEWRQTLCPLAQVLETWDRGLWTQAEFVRVWWLPYLERAVVWQAAKTEKARRPPRASWYGGRFGFHAYHLLLYLGRWVPWLLPRVEWLVFGMQYGFRTAATTSSSSAEADSAVEEGQAGLLMDCLYSQFVNEWALPLDKGPEAITRLAAWIHGDQHTARIPISPRGVYVHSPIEVRVSDTHHHQPRSYLDPTHPHGPTLYLNATLYRPYGADPPGRACYYAAFEHLMKELGGRPHWAKNMTTVTRADIQAMYGARLHDWLRVRQQVDPDGMFVGAWHRRYLLPADDGASLLPLEEKEASRAPYVGGGGGTVVVGEQAGGGGRRTALRRRSTSEDSFDLMQAAEAEKSTFFLLQADHQLDHDEDGELGEHGGEELIFEEVVP